MSGGWEWAEWGRMGGGEDDLEKIKARKIKRKNTFFFKKKKYGMGGRGVKDEQDRR